MLAGQNRLQLISLAINGFDPLTQLGGHLGAPVKAKQKLGNGNGFEKQDGFIKNR
jgi:hypothetical protein